MDRAGKCSFLKNGYQKPLKLSSKGTAKLKGAWVQIYEQLMLDSIKVY